VDWFSASGYWLSRLVFQRALAVVYLIAFVAALNQFRPLIGERGLLPVPRFLGAVTFRQSPTIFKLRYSDRLFAAAAWTGAAVSVAAVLGLTERGPAWASMLAWAVLWGLYLSIVNVGQTWYGFGWESLLLEAGFLAIFLGSSKTAPPTLVLWLLRWLLFRVEFGAGLIKIRGDRCWRDLTCLSYHHETQPMPNPLSWYFHHLPDGLTRSRSSPITLPSWSSPSPSSHRSPWLVSPPSSSSSRSRGCFSVATLPGSTPSPSPSPSRRLTTPCSVTSPGCPGRDRFPARRRGSRGW
jgi:hypothetical protein